MLTSTDRNEYADILQRYMQGLDRAALTRVVNAEKWTSHITRDDRGAACLIGHAEPVDRPYSSGIAGMAFDALCDSDGVDRTVAACQLFCATLLRSREIAALEALCPLAAREETHA